MYRYIDLNSFSHCRSTRFKDINEINFVRVTFDQISLFSFVDRIKNILFIFSSE